MWFLIFSFPILVAISPKSTQTADVKKISRGSQSVLRLGTGDWMTSLSSDLLKERTLCCMNHGPQ